MCRTQWVLALLALHVGLAYSWDIAVSLGDQLVFYTNGTVTNTVNFVSHNLTALAYDEVHNVMLYVDKQSDNDTICGYNLFSMENKCFIKRTGSNIQSIAYDPPTETLFFTDTIERSINWISLKPGANNNVYGNLLIILNYGIASNIAVDSCNGYIYWTNPDTSKRRYMERIKFNGGRIIISKRRETITKWSPIFSFALDTQTQNIYYFEGCRGCLHNFLKVGDLATESDSYFNPIDYSPRKLFSIPLELTVSKDYLYWMNKSESSRTLWHLPKNATIDVEPNQITKIYNKIPLAMTAYYKLKDQIQGRQDCEALSNLIPTITEKNNSLNIQQTIQKQQTTEYTTVVDLFCVHGIKVCKCTPGYIGERCDVSVCVNYCFQGDCSINNEGLPKCRCNAGYSGERCEVYACHGYCLNGVCSLNEKNEPVCQCVDNYEGTRCEAVR